VFSVNPATGAENALYAFTGGTDGATPFGSLVKVGDVLYGTTRDGGTSSSGTVFAYTP
jgi:hypothetical protein